MYWSVTTTKVSILNRSVESIHCEHDFNSMGERLTWRPSRLKETNGFNNEVRKDNTLSGKRSLVYDFLLFSDNQLLTNVTCKSNNDCIMIL